VLAGRLKRAPLARRGGGGLGRRRSGCGRGGGSPATAATTARTSLDALRNGRAIVGRDVLPSQRAPVVGVTRALRLRVRNIAHRIIEDAADRPAGQQANADERMPPAAPPDAPAGEGGKAPAADAGDGAHARTADPCARSPAPSPADPRAPGCGAANPRAADPRAASSGSADTRAGAARACATRAGAASSSASRSCAAGAGTARPGTAGTAATRTAANATAAAVATNAT